MAVFVRGPDLVKDAPEALVPGLQFRPDGLHVADAVRVKQGGLVALILNIEMPPHHCSLTRQGGLTQVREHHARERTVVNRHQRNQVRQQWPVTVIDQRLCPRDISVSLLGGRQDQLSQNTLKSGVPDSIESASRYQTPLGKKVPVLERRQHPSPAAATYYTITIHKWPLARRSARTLLVVGEGSEGFMACGNNMVSRAHLQSSPAPIAMPDGSGTAGSQPSPQQVAAVQRQARATMDGAERQVASATTPAAANAAVKEAQRAVDVAHRMRGSISERSSIIRELERKLEVVKRTASAAVDIALQAERAADRIRRDAELAERIQAASHLTAAFLGVVPAQLAVKTASPAERSLGQGYAQVGGKPRNSKYAGQRFPLEERYPEVAARYPNSVEFDEKGFPDFSPYAVETVELARLPGEVRETSNGGFTWHRDPDFAEADAKTGWTDKRREEAGLLWHHHQDGKTMLLVPKDLHEKVGHTGGAAHEMNVAGPQRLITNYVLQSMHELLEEDNHDQ